MLNLQKGQKTKIFNDSNLPNITNEQQPNFCVNMIKKNKIPNNINQQNMYQPLTNCQNSISQNSPQKNYFTNKQNTNYQFTKSSLINKISLIIILFLTIFTFPIKSIQIRTLKQLEQQYLFKQNKLYQSTKSQYFIQLNKQYHLFYQQQNITTTSNKSNFLLKQQLYVNTIPQQLINLWNQQQFNQTFIQLNLNLPTSFIYKQKFHTFIYPYQIFQIVDQSFLLLDQAIHNIPQNIPKYRQNFQDQFKISQQPTTNQSIQTQQLNQTSQSPKNTIKTNIQTMFLLKKITVCTTTQTCKLLNYLPTNLILKPRFQKDKINLYKISQSNFIIQKFSYPSFLSSSQILSLWYFNLDINNYFFIFGFKNMIQNPTFYQQLIIGHQITNIPLNNTIWTALYNGSALRFITFTQNKMLTLQQLKQHISKHQNKQLTQNNNNNLQSTTNNSQNKIKIPKILQELVTIQQLTNVISTYHHMTYSQIYSLISKQSIQPLQTYNYAWYFNTMTIFQIGINQNQNYDILYYTRQPTNSFPSFQITQTQIYTQLQIQQQNNHTHYKQILAQDQYGNFFVIFNNKINQTTNRLRIFKNTVNQLQLTQQLIITNIYNKNYIHLMHIQNDKSYLAYYQQQHHKQQNTSILNRDQIKISYNLKIRQIYDKRQQSQKSKPQNPIYSQCQYNIFNQYFQSNLNTTFINNFQIYSINKISSQYLSICYNNNKISNTNQISCKIIHITCNQVYNFIIPQQYLYLFFNTTYNQYIFKWQSLQNYIYNYDISIKLIISPTSQINCLKQQQQDIQQINNTIKLPPCQTYLKILINNQKLRQHLNKTTINETENIQQKQMEWLYEDNNSIYYGIKYNINNSINTTKNKIINNYRQEGEFALQQQSIIFCSKNNIIPTQQPSSLMPPLNSTININSPNPQLTLIPSNITPLNSLPQNCSKLKQIQQQLYFPIQCYTLKDKYLPMYGIKLLQSKLKKLFKNQWIQTDKQQSNNCQLFWKGQENKDSNNAVNNTKYKSQSNNSEYQQQQVTNIPDNNNNQFNRIVFGISIPSHKPAQNQSSSTSQSASNTWKICRIILNTTSSQNFIISPQLSSTLIYDPKLTTPTINNPYHIYRCSFRNSNGSNILSKCNYYQWEATQSSQQHLPSNSKTILFIINQGQTYNLLIKQPSKINSIFFYIILLFALIGWVFVLRRVISYFCTYFGIINRNNQPIFREYPLDYFELKLKMKRMYVQKICKQTTYKQSLPTPSYKQQLQQQNNEDNCIFCLQKKQQNQKLIQIYCQHSYHKQCFLSWVKQQNQLLYCPICKRKLNVIHRHQYILDLHQLSKNKIGDSQGEIIL